MKETILIVYRCEDDGIGLTRSVPLATLDIDQGERLHPVILAKDDTTGHHGRYLKGILRKACRTVLDTMEHIGFEDDDEAFDPADRDRRIRELAWSEGWEEGQFYEEALEGGRTKDQAQAKDLSDNPYRKKES